MRHSLDRRGRGASQENLKSHFLTIGSAFKYLYIFAVRCSFQAAGQLCWPQATCTCNTCQPHVRLGLPSTTEKVSEGVRGGARKGDDYHILSHDKAIMSYADTQYRHLRSKGIGIFACHCIVVSGAAVAFSSCKPGHRLYTTCSTFLKYEYRISSMVWAPLLPGREGACVQKGVGLQVQMHVLAEIDKSPSSGNDVKNEKIKKTFIVQEGHGQ